MKPFNTLLLGSIIASSAACGGPAGSDEFNAEPFAETMDAICADYPDCGPIRPPRPPPQPRPNLISTVTQQPHCWEQEGWLVIVVSNIGSATAGQSELYVQNYGWGPLVVPSLAPGASHSFNFWYVPPEPPYIRSASADRYNQVAESNESDNGSGWGCASI